MGWAAELAQLRTRLKRCDRAIRRLERDQAGSNTPSPNLLLPAIPVGIEWMDLDLPPRVRKRLMVDYERPSGLSHLPARNLLEIKGFGVKSWAALLAAIKTRTQAAALDPAGAHRRSQTAQPEAIRSAQAIRDNPFASSIRADDIRFGARIRTLDPQARNAAEMAKRILKSIASAGASAWLRDRLTEFHEAMQNAASLTLESELAQFLAFVKNPRNRSIAARILGWDGGGGCTLRAAGADLGFSFERCRQICDIVLETVGGSHYAPVLDSALAYIRQHPDWLASEIESSLQSKGLVKGTFRLDTLKKAAAVFGRDPGFVTWSSGGRVFVVKDGAPKIWESIIRTARRSMAHWGAVAVSNLCSQLSEEQDLKASENMVQRVLASRDDFRWLDERAGWFWLTAAPKNPLLFRLRKVLCIVPRIDVADLSAALFRDHPLQEFVLPQPALLALCRQIPWCRVDGSSVEAAVALDPVHALAPSESTILRILQSHGGIMPVHQVEALCLATGMRHPTFWSLVCISPVIHKYAPRVYGIVGADPEPGLVEKLKQAHRETQARKDRQAKRAATALMHRNAQAR